MLSSVQPIVRAAVAVTALSALTRAAEWAQPADRQGQQATAAVAASQPLRSPCPPRTLPDQGVCIPVPVGPLPEAYPGAHADLGRGPGAGASGPGIPRRPDRPADHQRYRWPVPLLDGGVLTTAELDLPPDLARASGLGLAQERGTEVRLVALEGQAAEADVLYVGDLFGLSVVTRHPVRHGGRLRDYLLVFGQLQDVAPGLKRGTSVRDGAVIGHVGESERAGQAYLYFEIRSVRPAVSANDLPNHQLTLAAYTVPCDPRNELRLIEK